MAVASKTTKPAASWRQYNTYSGPVILGVDQIDVPKSDRAMFHVDRAYWLTTMVESGGKLGAIMAADGTAMTAGLDQHIAVYPKELSDEDYNATDDQGGLWQLLRQLETVRSSLSYQQAVNNLWTKLKEAGWYVAQDGTLRYLADTEVSFNGSGGKRLKAKAGTPVFGAHIRDTFTPVAGHVPKSGKLWDQAVEWASLFHALTSHVGGEAAQIAFGVDHLVKRTKTRVIAVTGGKLEDVGYGGHEVTSLQLGTDWSEELDLAMCVYQAHSVNAPAVANTCLGKARQKAGQNPSKFARLLIEQLGNSEYGRWSDDNPYGRYQRTRSAARESGLWSRGLFDGTSALMPKNV